jgi:hypothetical protein
MQVRNHESRYPAYVASETEARVDAEELARLKKKLKYAKDQLTPRR